MILQGTIVKGKQLGRTIGFPTANIQSNAEGAKLGQDGVYAAWIRVEGIGDLMGCMVNQGKHPTVPDGAPTIEAHIFGFSGDIYGRCAVIEPVAFLRPEVKFGSVEELKAQLERDVGNAKAVLGLV